ncbi:MAG: hypothetical protein HY316_04355 [Acidobacteria bacterium]|nr:hypothetical protein [Acidobacteriota bacterium]
MADWVYLSLWVEGFSAETMLAAWAKALAEFPLSTLSPGIRELAVYPFEWGEPPVLEQSFQEGARVEEAVPLAAEFLHEDYAYEAELNWDVWVPREPGSLDQWERVTQTISVACLGPQFEPEGTEDHPHLLVSLGLDSIFLPEQTENEDEKELLEEALEGVAGNCYRENISQLLGYLQQLEKILPLTRRLLWSASGEDLAERIRSAYGQ